MNIQFLYNYSRQGLYLALNIYNSFENIDKQTKIYAYRFLLQYQDRELRFAIPKEQIFVKLNELLQECVRHLNEDQDIILEIADVLLEHFPPQGNALIDTLRSRGIECRNHNHVNNVPLNISNTVYGDSQNVHNTTINKSVKNAVKNIVRDFYPGHLDSKDIINLKDSITNILTTLRDSTPVKKVLQRVWEDNATFGIGITIDKLFLSICMFIHQDKMLEHKNTLLSRVIEELTDSYTYCATGILSRLVNIIRGFTDNQDYLIKISTEDHCKAVVFNYLNNCLKDCKDLNVVDGILDKNGEYIMFIKKSINSKAKEWIDEYGNDFYVLVKKVVQQYTECVMY